MLSTKASAHWQTDRVRRPVLNLGSLDGILTGIRQLRRTRPLEQRRSTACACRRSQRWPASHGSRRGRGSVGARPGLRRAHRRETEVLDFRARGGGLSGCSGEPPETVKPGRIVDEDCPALRGVRRPHGQQIHDAAIVDLIERRDVRGLGVESGCGQSVPQRIRSSRTCARPLSSTSPARTIGNI